MFVSIHDANHGSLVNKFTFNVQIIDMNNNKLSFYCREASEILMVMVGKRMD